MQSLWQSTETLPNFPKLLENKKTSVLIIGGGITGVLTAYFLHQHRVPYILVEKDEICGKTTGHTTAKITLQHGLIYHKLIEQYGIEKARMYYQTNLRALNQYKQLCQNIECDFEKKDNYVYVTESTQNGMEKIENEVRALEHLGQKSFLKNHLNIPVKITGAICCPEQAQFHPLKFLRVISENLNIYEHTFAKEMIGTKCITDGGCIEAEKVIVATHFPFINKHGSYFIKMYQHRSYVLALSDAHDIDGMYVDEDKKGMSFRNYRNMLLLGGGGHRTGKAGGNWSELRQFAKNYYPDLREEYAWAAQDCITLDDIPYIGNYSAKTPNLYVAAGFNKWGMTGAMSAAMLLTDKILGKNNLVLNVFSPSRSILKPRLITNALEAAANLITPATKRCPHLGCALKWNAAEHSWDCPCHGSRFTKDGKVLDNPANGDLRKP